MNYGVIFLISVYLFLHGLSVGIRPSRVEAGLELSDLFIVSNNIQRQ